MGLHELLRELPVRLPAADCQVTGVSHDSRRVEAGDLYVAIVGERFDGRNFARQAADRGAVAVMGPDPAPAELGVPWIAVDDPRALLGPVAARLYDQPHERLLLVGVTGTNGKGTVVRLVARILDAAGRPAGLGGTLGYGFAGRDYCGDLDSAGGPRTTLEASDFVRVLRQMADGGAAAMVMEVSSHGLAMDRVAGLEFDLAVFTNLSRDHLDFHGDFESYFAAKRRLFTDYLGSGGRSVVHLGDDWARRLAAELGDGLTTCGEDEGDVHVRDARLDLSGIEARIATPRGDLDVTSRLLGRFNLANVTTAVAAAEALELPHEAIARGVAAERPLKGRLEPVRRGQDFPALVDYAHTPDGLGAALASLRELSDRHLAVVFGCGGDRDRGKRPEMGRVAGELADLAIATSDNPRSEDPEAILDDVEAGLRASGGRFLRDSDRRGAIREAVAVAAQRRDGARWTVLVAGKGHEEMQITGSHRVLFSDRRQIEEALAAHGFMEDADG